MEMQKPKIEFIIALRSEILVSDLARLERDGWDADLSHPNFILFKRDLYE